MSDPDSTPMTVSMRGFLVLAVMEAAPLSMHDALKVVDAVLTRLEQPTPGMIAQAEACMFEHMPDSRDWTLTMAKEAIVAAIRAARAGKC